MNWWKTSSVEPQIKVAPNHIFQSINLATLAVRCRRWSLAAWRSASPGAAECSGHRRWRRCRWWSEEEASTRPPTAGWEEPPSPPYEPRRCCSPSHFVWWDTTQNVNTRLQVYSLLSAQGREGARRRGRRQLPRRRVLWTSRTDQLRGNVPSCPSTVLLPVRLTWLQVSKSNTPVPLLWC